MSTLNIEIPNKLNDTLSTLAKQLHESENVLVVKAIETYVDEMLEDIEDIKAAEEVLNNPNPKYYTSEEVRAWIDKNCHD